MIPNRILLNQGKVILSVVFLSYRQCLGFLRASLSMKTKSKQAFSNSTFSVSSSTRAPTSFSNGPTFSLGIHLLLMYLKKPFLLSLIPLAGFNSKWTLAFLVAYLHALTTFLYSSQVACLSFHIPLTFLFHLSLARSSLLIHAVLLPPLLDFFLRGMHRS